MVPEGGSGRPSPTQGGLRRTAVGPSSPATWFSLDPEYGYFFALRLPSPRQLAGHTGNTAAESADLD